MLALLTNEGASSSPQWTVASAGYSANEDLVDVVSCTKITADSSGGVSVTASGGNPMVIVPASSLNKTGSVCADLATGTQSSDAARLGWSSAAAALVATFFLVKALA